ncbi:CBS domain-containing protein [Methylorubrum extorquens]|uniref:CBS domain-containing protein n=1 Tax=Methylorubrum extorquens TaxID=408 RepID=UPI001EE5A8A2|nr:CBS domain-containing protein [Methylorubrum extorquens]MCG5248678.1 CBS domain-containing protein [Methylorubrum extorquens]
MFGTMRREPDAGGVRTIHRDRSVAEAAQLLAEPGTGALVVVEGDADATVTGLLTQRDIFRAVATEGPEIYNRSVWLITDHDFPAVDVGASAQERLKTFCERKVDHIALMESCRISAILSIWDCAGQGVGQDMSPARATNPPALPHT